MTKEELIEKYGSIRAASRALKIPRTTLMARLESKPTKEKYTSTGDDTVQNITSVSSRIRTVEDALKHGEVDTNIWEVDRYVINSWEVGAKVDDEVIIEPLWQIKIWLRRRVPKEVELSVESLFLKFTKHKPPNIKKGKSGRTHLLELSLSDCHFGKIGQNYSLVEAVRVFKKSMFELVDQASKFDVEQILMPLGSDFFHVDSWSNTTTKGTLLEADGHFTSTFDLAGDIVKEVIDRCLLIAPVKIIYVPGNHDKQTSWYLCKVLEAWYSGNKEVETDCSPEERKYVQYGFNLLGYTHGDEEKHSDLPMIMANEVPRMFADTKWRTWRTGHFHRKKQTNYVQHIEHGGVLVTILPSLSGTDGWHYRKGYIGNIRSAEAHLWHKENGPLGMFSSNI